MTPFPISSLIYIFAGTTCLIYSFHYRRIWKKTQNIYSKMFWELGLWVMLGEYLYGIPSLIYPGAYFFKPIFWFAASFAIFIGMTFGPLQIALISWGYKTTAIFAKIAVPAVIGLLIILNIVMQSPHSYIDNYGIIHWDINYPFNILWFMSGILITLMPLIFLFTAKPKNQKASAKKTLFTITFLLGGLGGWSTVIFQSPILLAAAFSIFFLGFLSLAIMTILDITMKDDDSENTD